ncbi:hypothetical protein EOM39_02095 [Candidatus Gracilibacteria bacterium]|nr:hypothetical protein [Candidatus Gracilibacteria bacterium]
MSETENNSGETQESTETKDTLQDIQKKDVAELFSKASEFITKAGVDGFSELDLSKQITNEDFNKIKSGLQIPDNLTYESFIGYYSKYIKTLKEKYGLEGNQVVNITKEDLDEFRDVLTAPGANIDTEAKLIYTEVIETNVENKTVNFDTLSIGIGEPGIKLFKDKLGEKIGEKFKDLGLDDKQLENIKIGIFSKIINGDFINNNIDSLKKFVNGVSETTLLKEFPTLDADIGKEIDSQSKDLLYFVTKNKDSKDIYKQLLSNPKAIQEFKPGTEIADIKELTNKEMTDLLVGINDKIQVHQGSVKEIKEKVNSIFSSNKFEKFFKEGVIGAIIGWIYSLFKGFGVDTAELDNMFGEWGPEGRKNKKVVDSLKTYGKTGETLGANNGIIDPLKSVDLSSLDSTKMKPFFDNCKQRGIDVTASDFWVNVFNGNELKGADVKEGETTVSKKYKFGIDNTKIDGPEFIEFYKQLNHPDSIKSSETIAEPEANGDANPDTAAKTEGGTAAAAKPEEKPAGEVAKPADKPAAATKTPEQLEKEIKANLILRKLGMGNNLDKWEKQIVDDLNNKGKSNFTTYLLPGSTKEQFIEKLGEMKVKFQKTIEGAKDADELNKIRDSVTSSFNFVKQEFNDKIETSPYLQSSDYEYLIKIMDAHMKSLQQK